MDRKTDKLISAIGDMDTAYLEEALDYGGTKVSRKRIHRFPKLSAACVAVLVILGLSVTAFAISRIPLSWRDIFSPSQTVIGDEDEVPVISQQQPEQHQQQAAPTEEMQIKIEKVISDERRVYLLYSVKANEGAVLDQKGNFSGFELYFPGKMMSGAYVSYFLERKAGVPENELEGVVHADWQPGDSANGLVIDISNWQEKRWFDDVTIDFDVAEMVENAGENAKLPQCLERFRNGTSRYRWQPGNADIQLPCNASICNAGWEDGKLQLVMKGPVNSDEWSADWGNYWYFLDTRTNTVIYPDSGVHFSQPSEFDPDATDTDWRYFWRTVPVDKEALPYLELHWGGKYIFTTVLPGHWKATLDETPVTVQSEVLTENVPLSYAGETLLAKKIECSKLSMAVYFDGFVDSTADTWRFEIFDANGDLIPSNWGYIAAQSEDSCMFLTEFDEPIEPETVCKLTYNGETIFKR